MTGPEIYTDAYYEKIRDLENRHWWHYGMRRVANAMVQSAAGDWVPKMALDVGCGTGNNLHWMKKSLGAHAVYGIDIAFKGLSIGQENTAGPLIQASIFSLPFGSGEFDFALCEDVLQHLPVGSGDVTALTEINRVMRKGGWLLVRANSRLGMSRKDSGKDHDFQRYTLPDVVACVERAGFVVRKASYANCLPSVYAVLKDRLSAIRGTGATTHREEHHGERSVYQGHKTRDTAAETPRLNSALKYVISTEAAFLSTFDFTIPFGHTTFCLAWKPE